MEDEFSFRGPTFFSWTIITGMGVSKNRGTPKWMVKITENPIKMDDLGVPLFLETSVSVLGEDSAKLPAKKAKALLTKVQSMSRDLG